LVKIAAIHTATTSTHTLDFKLHIALTGEDCRRENSNKFNTHFAGLHVAKRLDLNSQPEWMALYQARPMKLHRCALLQEHAKNQTDSKWHWLNTKDKIHRTRTAAISAPLNQMLSKMSVPQTAITVTSAQMGTAQTVQKDVLQGPSLTNPNLLELVQRAYLASYMPDTRT